MKKLALILPLLILLIFSFGCEQGEEAAEEAGVKALTDEDVAAIKALGPAIDEIGLAGDWDKFVQMFAEDVVMMPPNNPAVKGRATYLAWIQSMGVKMTDSEFTFHEIAGYGDIAYATATYTEAFTIAGIDEPIADEGKILTILRKQPDGSWLFALWMWNSNLPLTQ